MIAKQIYSIYKHMCREFTSSFCDFADIAPPAVPVPVATGLRACALLVKAGTGGGARNVHHGVSQQT